MPENMKGKDHLEDIDTDRIMLQWILRNKGWDTVHWIHLALERDQQWASANMVYITDNNILLRRMSH
jgi:hypothetical protein